MQRAGGVQLVDEQHVDEVIAIAGQIGESLHVGLGVVDNRPPNIRSHTIVHQVALVLWWWPSSHSCLDESHSI